MMRASLERRLTTLESEYLALLTAALRQCASGSWGLFGHNDQAIGQLGRFVQNELSSPEARDLLDLGGEIEALRRKLGYAEPFSLHARLIEMRSSVGANTPGEPERARKWLAEMEKTDDDVRS
jgi:hypothetical protein